MQRKQLKGTDLSLPRLGFGAMRLPLDQKGNIDYQKASELIDYAMQHGVNYFDTAFGYHDGKSAEFLGKSLSKYNRCDYIIANKMSAWFIKTKEDMDRIFCQQLKDLKTDYIDMYLLHSLTTDNWEVFKKLDSYNYFAQKKKQGIIKHLGFSFHGTPELLREVLDNYEWDFAQIQFNYLDYFSANSKIEYQMLTEKGIPVIVMEPVRGGKLANLPDKAKAELDKADPQISPACWALNFVRSFDNVTTVLSGMSNMDQVKENIELFSYDVTLGETEMTALYRAANQIRRIETIPCTECRYCTDGCPAEIKIPDIFRLYNKYLENKDMGAFMQEYKELCPEKNRADNCLACGVCMEKCPQNIPIPDILAQMPKIKQ